jgi:hypothetical protein
MRCTPLAGQAHGARDLRHRTGAPAPCGGPENLPARAGEPEIPHERVARGEKASVEAKRLQDQLGEGGGARHGANAVNMTTCCQ